MKNEPLKQIGTGAFTKAYLDLKNKNRVVLHSICKVKEAFSEGWGNSHRLFPEIKKIDSLDSEKHGWMHVYEMPFYEQPKSLKKSLTARQYRLYQALRQVYEMSYTFGKWGDGIYDRFREMPSEFKEEKEALIEALDGIKNYTDQFSFEISPRNVAVKGGKLILLDVFYCRKTLRDVRNSD